MEMFCQKLYAPTATVQLLKDRVGFLGVNVKIDKGIPIEYSSMVTVINVAY